MNISNFIKKQRIKQKLTQNALGELLNVANTTISNYEQGVSMPDLNTFFRLLDIFNASHIPLISLIRDKADKLDFYKTIYEDLCKISGDIPENKLETITTFKSCKLSNSTFKRCIMIVESNPEKLSDNSLVLARFNGDKELMYKVCYCKQNTYLVPVDGPSYLTPIKIDKDKIPLKRILAIINHP